MPNITSDDRDRLPQVWNMSQERALRSTLVHQRFNFFLFFFTLIIAAVLGARTRAHMIVLLGVGSLIGSMLAAILMRGQYKLNIVHRILLRDVTHPYTIIERQIVWPRMKGANIMGRGLPVVCCLILIVGFILALAGILPVFGSA